MKRKKWLIVTSITIVLVLIYVVFIRDTSTPVKLLNVKDRVVQRTVSASGKVKSANHADLTFSSLGRVYLLNAVEGVE
ncbi:hypothetical protein ACFL0C_01685 [Patescibacteria group bacterium]